MKKSLFDNKVRDDLKTRIDKINENTVPQWGTMKPAQMVHHVYLSTTIASGKLVIPDRSNFLTRTVLRYFMLSGMMPPKKRLEKSPPQTMDEINMVKANIEYADLNTERQRLKETWEVLASAKEFSFRHPLIGKMKRDHWGQQLYSHANYHLTQFGV